jgi:hypothetical protein
MLVARIPRPYGAGLPRDGTSGLLVAFRWLTQIARHGIPLGTFFTSFQVVGSLGSVRIGPHLLPGIRLIEPHLKKLYYIRNLCARFQ